MVQLADSGPDFTCMSPPAVTFPSSFRRPIYAHHAGRLLLAGLFLWAGARKAMAPDMFLQDIESFQVLPYRWAWLGSIWLPYLEITSAVALLWGRKWTKPASALFGVMLLSFVGATVSAWARGLTLSCGCFGHSSEPSSYPWLLARNLVLLVLAGWIFRTGEAHPFSKIPPIKPIKDTNADEQTNAAL